MSSHYNEFVVKGARYCESLFLPNELFYRANALVERIIAEESGVKKSDIDEISYIFRSSANACESAIENCKEFTDFSNKYPGQDKFIDDSEVSHFLLEAKSHLNNASNLFKKIVEEEDLQEQIWADDRISESFMGAARALSQAVLWQISSAERTHSD